MVFAQTVCDEMHRTTILTQISACNTGEPENPRKIKEITHYSKHVCDIILWSARYQTGSSDKKHENCTLC